MVPYPQYMTSRYTFKNFPTDYRTYNAFVHFWLTFCSMYNPFEFQGHWPYQNLPPSPSQRLRLQYAPFMNFRAKCLAVRH